MDKGLKASTNREKLKPLEQSFKSLYGIKLILIICVIFIIFIYKFITGSIPLDVFIQEKNDPTKQYKLTFEEFINRISEVKEYIITFGIMLIITYYLSEKNREWELKNLTNGEDSEGGNEDQEEKKKEKRKLSTVKEEKEGEDQE